MLTRDATESKNQFTSFQGKMMNHLMYLCHLLWLIPIWSWKMEMDERLEEGGIHRAVITLRMRLTFLLILFGLAKVML